MVTTPIAARPSTPTLTINPILAGTDVITAAHYATPTPILFGGTETGLNGQPVNIEITKDFGPAYIQGVAETPAANGAWSTEADIDPYAATGGGSNDGTFTLSALVGPLNDPLATVSETVILARLTTPFSAVGLAFLDENTALAAPSVPKAGIDRDLSSEVAGLTTLHQLDGFPTQPFHKLIKDINAEISTLDFKTTLPTDIATPSIVAKLVADQDAINSYVNHTPSLVALMPAASVTERGW